MKSAGKARNNGLYRHIRTSKEIIRNLLNDLCKFYQTKNILATTGGLFLKIMQLTIEFHIFPNKHGNLNPLQIIIPVADS